MIHIYGTSHVSQESIKLIDEKIDEHDPEIVALELDPVRLNALLSDNDRSGAPIFIRILKKFQERIGKKTGVMPGEEMLHAYHRCLEDDREVGLIDQDIRITVQRLKGIRAKEKVKAGLSLLFSLFASRKFDLSKIPEDEVIENLLDEARVQYPGIYTVLVEERNIYMARALKQLQQDNPEKDIVAFVGAGHKEELRRMIEEELDFEETENEDEEEIQ